VAEIRQASHTDLTAIVQIMHLAWPDSAVNGSRITGILENRNHKTHVAVEYENVAGFVDGFITTSHDGVLRWEVDLLAVHPDYRGRGIGCQLIAASSREGRERSAALCRALVRTDNRKAALAFSQCKYTSDLRTYGLYVNAELVSQSITASTEGAHLIAVETLSYCGVWVEGALSEAGFAAANRVCIERQLDACGAVIPVEQNDLISAAQSTGYALIGQYNWWIYNIK
jgi:N-acetylglutamate synthase-like GNAT family acetyltransferase